MFFQNYSRFSVTRYLNQYLISSLELYCRLPLVPAWLYFELVAYIRIKCVKMGAMLLDLLRTSTEKQTDCSQILTLTVNLVKFNSAYLDPEIVSHLIGLLFWYTRTTNRSDSSINYYLYATISKQIPHLCVIEH